MILNHRINMAKGDAEGFIVKFVERKGQRTEHATKAYAVNSIFWLKLFMIT